MRKIISVIWTLFAQINSFAAVNNQHNVIKRVVDNPVGTQRRQRFSARSKVRLEFSFKAKLLDPLIWSIFSLNAKHDLPNKLSTPSTPHRLLPPISSSASGSLEHWASREKLAVVQSAGMKHAEHSATAGSTAVGTRKRQQGCQCHSHVDHQCPRCSGQGVDGCPWMVRARSPVRSSATSARCPR